MKLFYIANLRLPTWRAHGIQIMKTCEAFAREGYDVELLATSRRIDTTENPFNYYKVEENFKITRLWCVDLVRLGWLGFWIGLINFTIVAMGYIIFKKGIFYTRDEFVALCLKLIGKKVIWEAHIGQKNVFVRLLILLKVPVVVISGGLKNLYVEMGILEERILVAHDGVDLEQFNQRSDKVEARKKLGLNIDEGIVMYTGSRHVWKGVRTLEYAASLLSSDIKVLIITDKSHLEIPVYLNAADILILPNSARNLVSKHFTSPMKLFEYMASGRPIVASDLPSTREVLNDSMAYFFEPDNPINLAKVIEYVINHKEEANEKSARSLLESRKYTWEERAKRILKFVMTQNAKNE